MLHDVGNVAVVVKYLLNLPWAWCVDWNSMERKEHQAWKSNRFCCCVEFVTHCLIVLTLARQDFPQHQLAYSSEFLCSFGRCCGVLNGVRTILRTLSGWRLSSVYAETESGTYSLLVMNLMRSNEKIDRTDLLLCCHT